MRRERITAASAVLALLATLAIAGCGESDGDGQAATSAETPTQTETSADEPAAPPEVDAEDPGAAEAGAEASPEAEPAGPEGEALAEDDAAATRATIDSYFAALNAGDGFSGCGVFAPGALRLEELPVRRDRCAPSLSASIGYRGGGGTPVWKGVEVATVDAVSVGGDEARVTATVTHRFAGRREPSVEEDVIYLRRTGPRWALAQPSAALYRAVGYPEPPLRAFTPPN